MTGVPPSGSGLRPSGAGPQDASQAEPLVPNADDLPFVTHEGVVQLGAIEIKVLQLSNGERVIEEDSLRLLMEALFGDQSERTGA